MSTPLQTKLRNADSNRLFWWVSLIAGAATAVLCGSFFVYWLHFGSGKISTTPSD